MREFVLADPLFLNDSITITCTDDHCTDIWWDYSHPGLIWGITCEEGHDVTERPCRFFVEEKGDSKDA